MSVYLFFAAPCVHLCPSFYRVLSPSVRSALYESTVCLVSPHLVASLPQEHFPKEPIASDPLLLFSLNLFPLDHKSQPNPPDLVGSWALDSMGWDGLNDLPGDGSEVEDYGLHDLVVAFRKDGRVQVPAEAGVGLQWRVEPGPTHLDTVYFEMIPSAPEVRFLS